MAFVAHRNYVGVTVTLAAANTNYNLLALVNAILAAETGTDNTSQCSGMARSVNLQAYPGIEGTGINTNDILVGDAFLSTTRIGYILNPGGAFHDSTHMNNVNVGDIYVRSAGTSQKINVTVVLA